MKKVQKFIEVLKKNEEDNNIYIFGAGTYGKLCAELLERENIKWKGFIDNNTKLINETLYGKSIVLPQNIENAVHTFVIISLSSLFYSKTIDEAKEKFISLGVDQEKIIAISDDIELVNDIIYYLNDPEEVLNRNKFFKNRYEGRRCFIIGNGPSLKLDDLERLADEITMGCNGIFNLFDKTEWRPYFFFCEDTIFLKKHVSSTEELELLLDNCQFAFTTLRSELYKKYSDRYDNLFYLYSTKVENEMRFSDDICKRIYGAGTTLFSMLQVAVYMGIKEIYLLGVDSTFKKEMHSNGQVKVNTSVNNHMEMMEQINEGVYLVDLIMEGWLCAREYAEKHGIKIYNATRGGKLEVFERIDFDNLFEK